MWVIAVVLCAVLGLTGMSSATSLMYDVNSQKWRDLEVLKVPGRGGGDVDNDYYGTNCYCFVDWVLKDDGRGALSGFCYEAYLNGLDSIMLAQYLNAHHNSSGPSEAQVREAFQKASAGDVVQMRWSYYSGGSSVHTALINGFESNGVYFFQSHVSGYGVKKISNSFYTYSELARRYTNPGYRGGFSIYRFGSVPFPPRPDDDYVENPAIYSQGLRSLTSSKYAKIYTLSSGRYYNLYSNKELTSRLSSSAWTGENDEDWLLGVGVNSNSVVYAQISYPTSSGRRTAYVRLRELFVKGSETESFKAARSAYGLYRRLNSGRSWSYGIDAEDQCYLLTKENGWCQVMYATSDGRWRIAWMPENTYNVIKPGPIPIPVITSIGSLPKTVVAGTWFSNTLTATGSTPITWSTSAGTLPSSASHLRTNLPPGLSISGSGTTGTISGTVAHTDAGKDSYMPLMYYFSVTAANSSGSSAHKQSYIVVYEPPVFETAETLARGDLNSRYNQTIKAKGTEWSMRWKITKGKLPPGLTFNGKSSKREATITGIPTQTGCFRFTVELSNLVGDSSTTTTREFVIYVGNVATEYQDPNIQLLYNFLSGQAGTSYYDWTGIKDTSSPSTKNLDNYIFLVSKGSLPPGLSIEEKSANGYNVGKVYLSGIPKASGTYEFTLQAKRISDGGYNTRSYTLKISPASSTAWRNYSMSLRGGFVQWKMMRLNYSSYITVRGGSSPYTASVVAGELPPGTRLEAYQNYIFLEGVPKKAGAFPFTIRVTGSNNGYVEQSYTVNIAKNPYYKSGGTGSTTKPKYTSKELPDAHVGSMWEATLECSGAEPIAWYAVGDLPDWMTLEEDTGRISGIPMELGKYKFKVKAENEKGSVTKSFKVKVVKTAPTIITASLPDGRVGVEYTEYLRASGTDPIKWSKIGKFPSGLKLDKKEGIIYGTPKKAGPFNITVKAKNKAGEETVQLSIVILKADDSTGDDKEAEDDEGDTSESTGQTNTPSNTGSAPTADTPDSGSTSDAVYTRLYLLSGDEKLEGYVPVEAGEPLTFEIGQWQDEYGRNIEVSDVAVFVNDEAVSADISEDGIFTLPAEAVNGDFIVYASAHAGEREFRTLEISAAAGEQESYVSASSAGNGEPAPSSHGGCSAGVFGVAGLICAGIFLFGRKPR